MFSWYFRDDFSCHESEKHVFIYEFTDSFIHLKHNWSNEQSIHLFPKQLMLITRKLAESVDKV